MFLSIIYCRIKESKRNGGRPKVTNISDFFFIFEYLSIMTYNEMCLKFKQKIKMTYHEMCPKFKQKNNLQS